MRVLFLENNPVWIHGLPNGFRDAGHQVMISGPLTKQNIPKMISEFQPDLAVSIGWGLEQTQQKQAWIRESVQAASVPLAYWAVEDPAFTENWTLPLIRRMNPDIVFTICPVNVDYYRKLGIKAAHLDFGYHSSVHCPVECVDQYRHSIALVANAYPNVLEQDPDHYRLTSIHTLILPLLKNDIRIDFYGRDWDKMKPFLGTEIPYEWNHQYLQYTEANKVYSSSDIIIALQNYQTQVTQRTYEILGSGGFLLTNDTPGVRRLVEPGRDIIVSSSPEETLKHVHYYLDHSEQRKQIAEQGRSSIGIHSYKNRAEYMAHVLIDQGILQRDVVSTSDTSGGIFYYPDITMDEFEVYLVKKGDTLWGISKKYGVTVENIKRLNGLTSDMIYIGQYLKVIRKQQ